MSFATGLAMAAASINLFSAALHTAMSRAPGWKISRLYAAITLSAGLYNCLGAILSTGGHSQDLYLICSRLVYFLGTVHCAAWVLCAYASTDGSLAATPRSIRWTVAAAVLAGSILAISGAAVTLPVSVVEIRWAGVRYRYPHTTLAGDLFAPVLVALLILAFARLLHRYQRGERNLAWQLVAFGVLFVCAIDEALVASRVLKFLSLADLGVLVMALPLSLASLRRILREARQLHELTGVLTTEVAQRTSERDRAQTSLVAAERSMRELVESLDAIGWEADVGTLHLVFISEGARRLLGTVPESWSAHIHPDDREAALSAVRNAIGTGQPASAEYRTTTASGDTAWLRDFIQPLTDADGRTTRLRGLMIDVTVQHRLEDDLRQAQKLDAIGRLAGGIAHDFNNLLTVINGYGDLLLRRTPPGEPTRDMLEEIRSAGGRAASLTQQLLAFSRKQVTQLQTVDLNAVIAETEKMLRRTLGEDIALVTSYDPDLGPVTVDSVQIQQVLINLAVNARDAMPDGGCLKIETARVDLDAAWCAAHPEAVPGPYVALLVADTGAGMDDRTQSRIFEPFFTTKELGKGTGLGMSIVYGIVRQHQGSILLTSAPGEGTTFTIYLPRTPPAVPPDGDRGIAPDALRGSETILMVEDQGAVRRFGVGFLRSLGYSVFEAADGHEALRLAQDPGRRIDIVVTDVVMPGMSGSDLVEQIRRLKPDAAVLFVSGHSAEILSRHGVLDTGAAYLPKPFSPELLAAKVREALERRPPMPLNSSGYADPSIA